MTVLEGCTLVGVGIGAIADSKKPDRYNITAIESVNLERETPILCILKNGKKVRGSFEFVCQMNEKKYTESFKEFQESVNHDLPSLYDTINITSIYSRDNGRQGILYGFEINTLLLYSINDNTIIDTVSIEGLVKIINENEIQFKGEVFKSLNGKVPVRTGIGVSNPYDYTIRIIPLNEIQTIKVGEVKNSKIVGGCVGLVIDTAILTGMYLYFRNNPLFHN